MARPARFLFVLWDGGGNVMPVLLLARRLICRGHQVDILSNPCLAQRVTATGARFHPFRHAPDHDPRWPETDAVRVWEGQTSFEVAELIRERLMFGPVAAFAADVEALMAAVRPDVVCADYVLFGALAAAEAATLPTAVVMDSIYPLPQGRDQVRRGPFTYMFQRLIDRGLETLNGVRRELGLADLEATREQYDRAQRVLVMTYPTFDPPTEGLPSNVRHVGPQLEWPEEGSPRPAGPPRVLVSFSTAWQGQEEVAVRVVETLMDLPVRVVVTTGPALRREQLPSAANVEVHDFLPHEEVMPGATAVVTHGGHGTTIRSLVHGVPLLVIPFAQDQFDNARRVSELGAGLELSRQVPVGELRASLERLVGDREMHKAAARTAEALRREHLPLAAAEELEGLVAG